MKPLLTIVIPTWNRRRLLSVALDSILAQIEAARDLPVEVIVSDHGSTDGTFDMLKQYEARNQCLSLRVCRRTAGPDFSHNFQFAFDQAAQTARWVWTFGDDDQMLPGALEKVLSLLDEKTPFVHIAESARSKSTGKILGGTLMEIANNLGFIDMTGFITCNITRADKLQAAVNSPNWDAYAETAFPQSLSILEACAHDQAAFHDIALVEAQDRDLSGPLRTEDDRGQRWANANIGARYSYIVTHLRTCLDAIGHSAPLKPSFFRYLSYYLWDRFIIDQVNAYQSAVIANPGADAIDGFCWDLFAKIGEYLTPENAATLRGELEKAATLCNEHFEAVKLLNLQGRALEDFVGAHSTEQFPFTYIGAIGEHP